MTHIFLDLNGYIDPWLHTGLVHGLYLKSMEGHFPMIDCDPKTISFFDLVV